MGAVSGTRPLSSRTLFYLALREPQSLLLPSVPWPDPSQVPSLQEDPEKVLALAKVWDANDLLVLSPRGPPAVRG